MAEKAKICCMFDDPVPGHAVDSADWEFLASEKHRHEEEELYRCRKCGAFVLYRYAEDNRFDWDNAFIDEDYIPVEEPEIKDGKYSIPTIGISGAPIISARYMEADWRKDKDWFYR